MIDPFPASSESLNIGLLSVIAPNGACWWAAKENQSMQNRYTDINNNIGQMLKEKPNPSKNPKSLRKLLI